MDIGLGKIKVMARTIQQIYDEILLEKQQMAELVNLQPQIDNAQNLLNDLNSSSKVSIWRLFMWLMAVGIWSFEKIMDAYKEEIEARALQIIAGTTKWYWKESFLFQYGDTLQWINNKYQYSSVNTVNQIIKRVAVIEASNQVRIKVAKLDGNNTPIPLTLAERLAFENYIGKIKIAGTDVAVITAPADELIIHYDIHYNPQAFTPSGESILTPGTFPVEDVINSHIQNLPFNGILNITKLTDAIQQIEGVVDPVITASQARYGSIPYVTINNNYNANSGHMVIASLHPLSQTLNYIQSV